VCGKPGRDILGFQLLGLLPFELGFEGANPLLSVVTLLASYIALLAEPVHDLEQPILLPVQSLDHRGILARPCLRGCEPPLHRQLQLPLLLNLAQEVEDLLAGVNVLLK
jgi:hypothetical protein